MDTLSPQPPPDFGNDGGFFYNVATSNSFHTVVPDKIIFYVFI